jgi:predicted acetyltransferase
MTITAQDVAEKMLETTILTAKSQTFFGRFGWSYNVMQYGQSGNYPNAISRTVGFHFISKSCEK